MRGRRRAGDSALGRALARRPPPPLWPRSAPDTRLGVGAEAAQLGFQAQGQCARLLPRVPAPGGCRARAARGRLLPEHAAAGWADDGRADDGRPATVQAAVRRSAGTVRGPAGPRPARPGAAATAPADAARGRRRRDGQAATSGGASGATALCGPSRRRRGVGRQAGGAGREWKPTGPAERTGAAGAARPAGAANVETARPAWPARPTGPARPSCGATRPSCWPTGPPRAAAWAAAALDVAARPAASALARLHARACTRAQCTISMLPLSARLGRAQPRAPRRDVARGRTRQAECERAARLPAGGRPLECQKK